MAKRIPSIMKSRPRPVERRSGPWGGPGASGTAFLPAPVVSGVAVTPETALNLTSVFAAVNVISTDASSLPLTVLRRSKTGGRAAATNDPRYDLLYCEPNEDLSSMRWRQALFGHVLTWGNGYSEIDRAGDGSPGALHLHSPKRSDTWPDRDRAGRLYYNADGGRRVILAEDMVHVAGLGWDGISGYSPVAMARQAIGLGIATEQFGASWFGNSSVPKGFLKHPGKLSPEAKRNLREGWEAVHQGPANGNRVAVLAEGLDWQSAAIPPEDAQFLQTRQFQVEEICRLYRLPPHKLSDYRHSHLANVEESNLDYLNTTLGPWLEALEQEINRKLFTSRERSFGLHCAHDTSALLRGNAAARTAIYAQLAATGAISPDEIRDREGLNPLPDDAGKVYFYPLNMAKLWPAAAEPDAPADAAPDPEAEAPDDADATGDGIGDTTAATD